MAINPETQYPGKIAPSSAAYPYGAARNITTPGDGTGTPWEAALVNDLFGWQQSILAEAGFVPTGTPEKVAASQYMASLGKIIGFSTPTLAALLDRKDVVEGTLVNVYERVSGRKGGAWWVARLTANVSPNGITLVTSNSNPLITFEILGDLTFAALGIFPDSGDITPAFQEVIDIIIDRGLVIGDRVKVESVGIEDGVYIQNGEIDLKSIRDFRFYSLSGGKGSVVFDVSGAAASSDSYVADNAAFGQFKNLTWKGLVDNDTNLFSFGSATSLIRGWDFHGCDVLAIKRVFRITGTLLCSEFTFYDCDFLQCFTFMYNNNTQAVNWNAFNCNWENDSLVFAGDNATSVLLFADKGTFLTWNGGSIIPQGGLVFCNWTAEGDAFRASHKVVFDKVRIEVFPTVGSTNPPLVDRTTSGYVNASNSMPVSFPNCTGLIRGGVVSPYIWANVWNRSSLTIDASEFESGEIHGIYDSNTETSTGELIINNNVALTYVDDSAGAKSADYVNHFVKITHDASQDSDGYDIDQRNATTIGSSREKIIRLRSLSGRIPLALTETVLPELPKNATIVSIGYRRLQVTNTVNDFTAELRSSDDVTLYATVTLANNARVADEVVLLESGIDIVTDLKVVFTGVAEIANGYFELRYI